MPTIPVNKAQLFKALGKEYTTEEFDQLCFDFGIELDEETTDNNGEAQLKIEIPANRYDMLCFEGIALNLNVFLGREEFPDIKTVDLPENKLQTTIVEPDTSKIRPYFSCAVLRDVELDQAGYDSFIALQDKLHQNLARQRTLVSIGTHDLDTIEGPFRYKALPPEQIKFVPLNQTKEMNGTEMMEFYLKDRHLSKFLHIIRDSPVFPIIYDKNGKVLSMPPIINSDHSKISPKTKNIFIDITATDKTKLEIVNHILVSMFSKYCKKPFTVEPVRIESVHNNETRITPNLAPRKMEAEVDYINSICGLDLSPSDICKLLKRMSYKATPSKSNPKLLDIAIPVTRADVLHQADIMEDVAIAYGFNKLPRRLKLSSAAGAEFPVGKLTDIVRQAVVECTWTEVMTLVLGSHDEHFAWLNHKDDGSSAVITQNPATAENQMARTTLTAGLLKCIRENRHHALPIKIFEVADVVLKDLSKERKARNERRLAAAWCDTTSGFQMVHGLLDRVMMSLGIKSLAESGRDEKTNDGYWPQQKDDPMYMNPLAADIYYRHNGKERVVGNMGVVHPTVLEKFEIPFPVSIMEINIEEFL